MFDCSGPTLVFVTQTHHPILEHHTGYIFALYDVHYHKPREMFFTHIAEAQVFALYRKARLEMNPDSKPDRVTALDYVLNAEDESRYVHMPDYRGRSPGSAQSHLKRKKRDVQSEFELNTALLEAEQELEEAFVGGELADVDFFGDGE